MKTKIRIIAALIAIPALLVIIFFALIRPLELYLNKELPLAQIKTEFLSRAQASGLVVSAQGIHYRIFQGIVLSGFTARFGTEPIFFHSDSLILETSLWQAMKKTPGVNVRIEGGKINTRSLSWSHLQTGPQAVSTLWGEGVSVSASDLLIDGKWKLNFESSSAAPKIEIDFTLVDPKKNKITGSGNIDKTNWTFGFRTRGIPVSSIEEHLPGLIRWAGPVGEIAGRGSIKIDPIHVAYDFEGELNDAALRAWAKALGKTKLHLNGGFVFKENIRLVSSFSLNSEPLTLNMSESFAAPGFADRQWSGRLDLTGFLKSGKMEFSALSRFPATNPDSDRMVKAKFQISNAILDGSGSNLVEVHSADLNLGDELTLEAKGKALSHDVFLKITGPFRFGDKVGSVFSGPLTLTGKMGQIDPEGLFASICKVHETVLANGLTGDAERAEDSGPLWRQRFGRPELLQSITASFNLDGQIDVAGIKGVTDQAIPIRVHKTAAVTSANAFFEKEGFSIKADYSIGFESDLPHQSFKVQYQSNHPIRIDYITGDPTPPTDLLLDYNSNIDGLLPADLVYKSVSNFFIKAKDLKLNQGPVSVLSSILKIKLEKLDDFEVQRVTEGGRTILNQVKATAGTLNVIGSAEYSSQEGGKSNFYVNGPEGFSKHVNLGVTETGKWYPSEN